MKESITKRQAKLILKKEIAQPVRLRYVKSFYTDRDLSSHVVFLR